MREKKPPRVLIAKDIRTQVLHASDRTCCVCHIPGRPVQIHHIDDDRSNSDPANLAVLCLLCHNDTLVTGGYGRRLFPEDVRHARDEWLRMVKEKKRTQAGQPASVAPAQHPRRTMTREQARRQAQRLRDLYTAFFDAVLTLEQYADQLARPWGKETWDARRQRLLPMMNEPLETINNILPQLRVEPGTLNVCRQYEMFLHGFRTYCTHIKSDYDHNCARFNDSDHKLGFWRNWNRQGLRSEMYEHASALQAAIQNHVRSVDRLT